MYNEAELIAKLEQEGSLNYVELAALIDSNAPDTNMLLASAADKVRRRHYGDAVFIRGLIEFTNYCKNNCFYCGIRAGNSCAQRYRLSEEDILSCCAKGYDLGFRTFVLQGGEDPYFTDDKICSLVAAIRTNHPDCAITLSIGEKPRSSYQSYFDAGANRYLLRHETATRKHYYQLHPQGMSFENRIRCLYDLKDIGYQVGSGFMVAPPYQTTQNLITDLRFLQKLAPDMIGIGPYIPHNETPFNDKQGGSLKLSLRMLSILRLMFPYALLPSTTALGSIHPHGRELGLQAGGNVVMPNLSPGNVRKYYAIYNNKLHSGLEAAQSLAALKEEIHKAGYQVVIDKGDVRR